MYKKQRRNVQHCFFFNKYKQITSTMQNPPYFSQYVSPNIVIVPTVSFCEPPNKKIKRDEQNDETPAKNNTEEAPETQLNNSVNINCCNEAKENQCSALVEQKTSMIVQKEQCSNLRHIEPIQCFNPPISTSGGYQDFTQDISECLTNDEREKMVKKTLSWASNYLRSIGQSHPKTSKTHQPIISLQQKSNVKIDEKKQNVNIPYNNISINFPSTSHLTKSTQQDLDKSKIMAKQLETLKKSTSPSSRSRSIKINLLDNKSSGTDLASSSKTSTQLKICPNKGTGHPKNTIESPVNKSSNRLPSKSRTHIDIKHYKRGNTPSFSAPRANNYTKHVSKDKETKHDIRNKVINKKYLDCRKIASNASKYNEKYKMLDHVKHVPNKSPNDKIKTLTDYPSKKEKVPSHKQLSLKTFKKHDSFKRNPDAITKHCIDKSKSEKSEEKRVERKSSTPIKSVVQVTENFELNGISHKAYTEDLRKKLKRKHLNEDTKRDNLRVTVQNECTGEKDCSSQSDKVNKTNTDVDQNTANLKQETRKYTKIKLVINLEFQNGSESSESEYDGKNNEFSLGPNVDLSFLDDFNVDDIVECLSSPKAKNHSNLYESLDIKGEEGIVIKKSPHYELADDNNNNKEDILATNSRETRFDQETDKCEMKLKLEQKISSEGVDENKGVLKEEITEINTSSEPINLTSNKNMQENNLEMQERKSQSKDIETNIALKTQFNENAQASADAQVTTESQAIEPCLFFNTGKQNTKENINIQNQPPNDIEIIAISESEDEDITEININEITNKQGNENIITFIDLDKDSNEIFENEENEKGSPIETQIIEDCNCDNKLNFVATSIALSDVSTTSVQDNIDISKVAIITSPKVDASETVSNDLSPTELPVNTCANNNGDPDIKEKNTEEENNDDNKHKKNKNISQKDGEIKPITENKTTPLSINNKNKTEIGKNVVKETNLNEEVSSKIYESKPDVDLPVSKALLSTLHNKMRQRFGVQYNITSLIRIGKFSKVFQCHDNRGETYALKVTHPQKLKMVNDRQKEVMLKSLQKDIPKANFHCINLIEGFAIKGHWCFLMEYYPNNLMIALADYGKCFHIDLIQTLARQLVSAILVLRNKNMAHLGLKPEHILLNNTNDRLKVAGFDEAQCLESMRVLPNVGKVSYRPPEVILGYPNFIKVDVWAAALILYEMATNHKLFTGYYNNDILFKQQCTLGAIPLDMLQHSVYRPIHYSGFYFLRTITKQKRVIVSHFDHSERVFKSIFAAYTKAWANKRTKQEKSEDKKKLNLFVNLLQEMLALHPRDRLPVEFAYTNPFIYASFDSCLWR